MKTAARNYLILDFLFMFFIISGYTPRIGLVVQESFFGYSMVSNYLELGLSNRFHWFIDELNNACRFDVFNLIMYNLFVIPYYALLKFYGTYHKLNVLSFRIVITEVLVYLVWYLWEMFLKTDVLWTPNSLLNAVIGFAELMMPLMVFALLMILGKYLFSKTAIHNLWSKHKKLYACLLLLVTAPLIPDVALSFLLCIFAIPVAVVYLYYILPKMLNKIIFNNQPKLNAYRVILLVLAGVGLFVTETFTRMSDTLPEESAFNGLLSLYLLQFSIYAIFYGIMIAIYSPHEVKKCFSKTSHKAA